MRIESIESIPLSYELSEGREFGSSRGAFNKRVGLLVRIETDDGSVGWGESSYGPPRTVSTLIEEVIGPFVENTDPHNVRKLCERLHTETYHFGRQGLFLTGLAGVEIAIWDLLGKHYGKPVYDLLGGSFRNKVTPYASTMYVTNWQDPSVPIEQALEEGFSAVKIKLGQSIDDDLERVRTARDILGDDAIIAIDFNGNYTPRQAIQSINRIKEYDIHWVEEPVPQENLAGYRKVSQHVDLPLAAGEAVFSRYEFKRLLDEGSIDILTPDIGKCGGLAEASFIADMATTENVQVRPHVWMGGIGIAANLQLAATLPRYPHSTNIPNPFLFECDRAPNPLRNEIIDETFDLTGPAIPIPDRPGLGVTPDIDSIERFRIS